MQNPLKEPRSLKYLMETPVPPARCWIGGHVLHKGSKMMVSSWAKSLKSWVALQMAKDLAFTGRLFGHPQFGIEESARVLLLEQEVGDDPLHERVQKVFVGADWDKVEDKLYAVSREPDIKMDTLVGYGRVAQYCKLIQPNVLILDPISRMMEGDDSANPEVRKVFENVDRLLEEFKYLDLSVVMVHHAGKMADDVKQGPHLLSPYKMRGASMWFDAPDSILTMYRAQDLHPGAVNRCRMTLRHGVEVQDFSMEINHRRMGARWVPEQEKQGKLW